MTMPREREGYSEQIAMINSIFPGRMTLKVSEIAKMENHDPRTIRKKYKFDSYGDISVEAYARALCRRN